MHKTALITGFTGQDGTFLTRFLLDRGYQVVGLARRVSTEPPRRIRGTFDFSGDLASGQLALAEGDLLSRASLDRTLRRYEPGEIYNLAAQSHVAVSFNQPEFTVEANFIGVVNLIESLCAHGDNWRMYQASTSEMFGNPREAGGMDEETPLRPTSPYAIAKTAAHFYCRMKREQGFYISSGILFNHESEIRGGDFVSQKIVRGVVDFVTSGGEPAEPLELGNLDARRDWGYAGDYVKAMWLMLQQPNPGEYSVGTGTPRTVRQFVEAAMDYVDRKIEWHGTGLAEAGLVDGRVFVRVNPEYFRPNDVNYLSANAARARAELGWAPETSFDQMIAIMVDAELERRTSWLPGRTDVV
jgi:GDPmannose 4,6-dehydratase